MKKILISLSIVGAVAAIGIGATVALFSDTETSAGNIFTAGSIDLKVDHLAQTYNGADCKTCSVKVYSSNNQGDMVTERNGVAFTTPYPAVLAWKPSAWMTEASFDPSGEAKWTWEHNPTQSPGDTQTNTSYSFQKTFLWMGPVTGATLDLALGSDNMYTVYLNGNQIGQDLSEKNFLSPDHITSIDASYFLQGTNVLKFVVTNKGVPGSNSSSNPAGLIYKFTINGDCNSDEFKNHCQLWGPKDLVLGDHFFDIGDVKPGDWGTNLISLHVDSNDAYTCLIAGNSSDLENIINNAEQKAGDVTTPLGELSKYLNAVIWDDINQDGIHQPAETVLYNGSLKTGLAQLSVVGQGTKYFGLAWCAGTQSVDTGTGVISCSGVGNQNDAQTDSFTADLTAYAIQQRNNSGFSCANVNLPTQGEGEPAAGPDSVNLGSANGFVIVAKTAITDATPAGSALTGNIAIDPAAGSYITGVSCTNVTVPGKIYSSGGYTGGYNANVECVVDSPVIALAARSAMETAYTNAAGRTGPDGTNLYAGNLGGQTFAPGLYKWTTGVTIPTDVTLSGGVNDVWIFQIAGTLDIASGGSVSTGIKVILSGGAQAKNVFWQVAGATTLGTYSTFNGTILAQTNIAIQTGAVLNGRAFAQTAVTLDANTVSVPLP